MLSLSPPALGERRHDALERRLVAVRRRDRYAARGGGAGFGGLGGVGFGGFDGTMALGILKIRIHECRNCRISNWQWLVSGHAICPKNDGVLKEQLVTAITGRKLGMLLGR
jgi:hypothetical protein